jgi:CHY zinc finger
MSEDYTMQDDAEMADSDDELDEDEEEEDEMNDEEEGGSPSQPEPLAEEDVAIARRRAIQAIMRDTTISEEEKRQRIQNLMSGGRTEVAPPPAPVIPAPEGNAACVHYERSCNIVAPCCNRVFGCRICHDELSPSGHPPMNRFLIREVVCKLCNTRQAAS